MEDSFMNFTSVTAAWDAAFTKTATTNGNMYTKLRQERVSDLGNASEVVQPQGSSRNVNPKMKGYSKGVQPYARQKKHKPQWPTDTTEKK